MTDERIPWWRRAFIAEDLDLAARALEDDANDLHGRFAPEHHEAVAGRKRTAADDVRAYAERIRGGEGDVSEQELKRAQTVAKAARYAGILTDSPVPERTWGFSDEDYGAASLQPWAEDNAVKNSLVDSGDMTRVGQLPFFALSSYGGATWEEAGRDGPPDDAVLKQLQEEQERAREAARTAVANAENGSSWTAAIKESGLDTYRQPDRWALEKRAADEASPSPATNRTAEEQAVWDDIGQAEIDREQAAGGDVTISDTAVGDDGLSMSGHRDTGQAASADGAGVNTGIQIGGNSRVVMDNVVVGDGASITHGNINFRSASDEDGWEA